MGNHRMFSNLIVDSDKFLDMPLSTQALYFHLGMKADDDGFVGNPKKIVRSVNCTEDDLKLLIAKNFVIAFESGIIVITHWDIHNHIQPSKKRDTLYREERARLELDASKVYVLKNKEQNSGNLPEPVRHNADDLPDNCRHKIRQDKVIQDKITVSSSAAANGERIDYQAVISLFNRTCVSLSKVQKLTDPRKRHIKTAVKTLGDLSFEEYFHTVEASDFLTGRKGEWKASFDWILSPSNMVKVIEGNYRNPITQGSVIHPDSSKADTSKAQLEQEELQHRFFGFLDDETEELKRWAESGDEESLRQWAESGDEEALRCFAES